MLDLRRLRLLTEIARHGSISAAAEAAQFTQPAVSRQIARLEAEVGVELVQRTSHGAELTEAGRLLVEHATAILARAERAERELEQLQGARSRRVRLGFFSTAAVIVHNAVQTMRERVPEVSITALEGEPGEMFDRLASGTLDLALVFADEAPSGADAESLWRLHLFDDGMWVALPAGHPLASRPTLDLEDLRHEDWGRGARADHPCSRLLSRAFSRIDAIPAITFESNDYAAVQELVAAGVGLALVPELAAQHGREDLVFRSLAGQRLARRVELVMASRSRRPQAHHELVDVLRTLTHATGPKQPRSTRST